MSAKFLFRIKLVFREPFCLMQESTEKPLPHKVRASIEFSSVGNCVCCKCLSKQLLGSMFQFNNSPKPFRLLWPAIHGPFMNSHHPHYPFWQSLCQIVAMTPCTSHAFNIENSGYKYSHHSTTSTLVVTECNACVAYIVPKNVHCAIPHMTIIPN